MIGRVYALVYFEIIRLISKSVMSTGPQGPCSLDHTSTVTISDHNHNENVHRMLMPTLFAYMNKIGVFKYIWPAGKCFKYCYYVGMLFGECHIVMWECFGRILCQSRMVHADIVSNLPHLFTHEFHVCKR